MNDESIFEGSDALKEFKEEWLNVDTKGVLNETIENSAYIYKLLKVQEADDRLEYLRYLKNHYEGNFPCLMKELIHIDTMLSGKNGPRLVQPLNELGYSHVIAELDAHSKTLGVDEIVDSDFGMMIRSAIEWELEED